MPNQNLPCVILIVETLKNIGYYPDGLVVQDAVYVTPGPLGNIGPNANYVISRASRATGLGRVKPLVIKVNSLYRARYGEDMYETNARSFIGLLVPADATTGPALTPFPSATLCAVPSIPG